MLPYTSHVSSLIICTGLFEQHKLLFSFSMTVKIQEVEESLNRDELDFFMKVNITHSLHSIYIHHCMGDVHSTGDVYIHSTALHG